MNIAINSPFRYAGGKFYARKLILEHLKPHNFYIEPFARFWNIQDSDVKFDTNHSGYRSAWVEPHNTTKEIGSKFGLQF